MIFWRRSNNTIEYSEHNYLQITITLMKYQNTIQTNKNTKSQMSQIAYNRQKRFRNQIIKKVSSNNQMNKYQIQCQSLVLKADQSLRKMKQKKKIINVEKFESKTINSKIYSKSENLHHKNSIKSKYRCKSTFQVYSSIQPTKTLINTTQRQVIQAAASQNIYENYKSQKKQRRYSQLLKFDKDDSYIFSKSKKKALAQNYTIKKKQVKIEIKTPYQNFGNIYYKKFLKKYADRKQILSQTNNLQKLMMKIKKREF